MFQYSSALPVMSTQLVFVKFELVVTLSLAPQTKANLWILNPSALLHSQPAHNYPAISCRSLSLLR